MNRILKVLFILTLSMSSIADAEIDDSPVDNKSTYHINENVDLVAAHDIQYEKPKIMIKMVFPRLSSTDNAVHNSKNNEDDNEFEDSFNESNISTSVNTFNESVAQIIKEEIGYFKEKVAAAEDYQKTLEKSKVKNRLTIDYNSAIMNLDAMPIISIRFVMQAYITGMAHPYRRYRTLNFDLESGAVILLADLFQPDSNYLQTLSQFVNNELAKKIRGTSPLSEGTAPLADNFRNWNINPSGLRFTFDEATVAPYVFGSQTILVPYSALKEDINPQSVLGRCLEHRRRCMRDPLLTGGFIDEAANTKHRRLNPALG